VKPSFLSLTDLFCGAGGASIGAELAGVKLVLGVNHWDRAIATHSTNFPEAAHDCRDVSETHPSRYGSTHLLWASPECPTWSQARGKRADQGITGQLGLSEEFEPLPTAAEVKSRVTMWDVVRYAEYHGYEAVVVENVVDVMRWSLLPVWYQAMEALGFAHRTVFLNSMFFGVPQSRDRWYVVFWKRANRAPDLDFRPPAWCPKCEAVVEGQQSFKKPKRWTDRYGRQYLYLCPACAGTALPFVTPALEAIDWSVLGERIGDRKDPLAPATMARIQAGIDRYWNRPVVFDELRDPKHRDALTAPMPTQTGRQSQALYIPLIAHLRGTQSSHLASSARPAADPMGTISAEGNHHGLISPLYVKNFGGGPEMSHPVDEPLGSITAVDHHALLGPPALVDTLRTHGTALSTNHPLRTLVAGTVAHALVVQAAGNTFERQPGSCRIRPGEDHPLWTLPGTAQTGLVVPAGGTWRHGPTSADEPLPTRTASETDGLVVPINGGRHGDGGHKVRSTDEPLLTQTGDLYRAFVSTYYRTPVNRDASEPMPTFRTVESHGLVAGAEDVRIEDCSFRMLMPPEIGRGMAFHDEYVVLGNQRERVQQYGQAVTPPVACWLLQRVVDSLR
jgi:DNA (cytosine-5)-methyltransferase 1